MKFEVGLLRPLCLHIRHCFIYIVSQVKRALKRTGKFLEAVVSKRPNGLRKKRENQSRLRERINVLLIRKERKKKSIRAIPFYLINETVAFFGRKLFPKRESKGKKETLELMDNLRFSAFYPEKVVPKGIGKILAYVHFESVTDAEEIAQDAALRLQLPAGIEMKAGSVKPLRAVPKESIIKVTPDVPGLVFDKVEATISLWEDIQSVEFRFKPHATSKGRACHGWVHFWLEGIVLADVAVTIFVANEDVPEIFREALAKANAKPYRHVFPSYSHKDAKVVERVEIFANVFGDEYMRDVMKLHSGQLWQPELLGFIGKADVFQLFWSENAIGSKFVEEEWRCAVKERNRRPDPYFVRPVYWAEKPALPIPSELQEIHFARIPYSMLRPI